MVSTRTGNILYDSNKTNTKLKSSSSGPPALEEQTQKAKTTALHLLREKWTERGLGDRKGGPTPFTAGDCNHMGNAFQA